MYAIDPATRDRIAPLLQRVLIVDSNAHLASLLGACLTAFGARSVAVEGAPAAALDLALTIDPTLFVTEAFDDADPFAFVRSIRRAPMACRQAPVIVLTTLATASAIKAAKDAGAHEFLRKPFAHRDLMRRLDHLAASPRAWVDKPVYTGPDRRSFNSGAAHRRLTDRMALIEQGVSASRLYKATPRTSATPA